MNFEAEEEKLELKKKINTNIEEKQVLNNSSHHKIMDKALK